MLGELGPGPGPEFDRWLDEAYDGDEQAKAAARADLTAMSDHHTVHATDAHETIAALVWRTLRALGIRGGRMLVIGQDPEVFAGVPADERRLAPGRANGFHADIPEAASDFGAPHPGLTLRQFGDAAPDEYDVVVHTPQHVDVALHRPGVADARRIAQIMSILGCLEHTETGGYCITLASREVMDAPDNRSRELIASRGELVGAVRLPAGALRPGLPGNDAVVDLLVFRRPLVPGSHITPCTFLPTHEQRLSNSIVLVNQYWLANPHHVLGDLDTRLSPWGPCTLTVRPTPGRRLFANLSLRLEDIVDHAHAAGLIAETGATVDARLHDAQRDDPDAPIDYRLVQKYNLDDIRRAVGGLRAGYQRANRNVAKGVPDGPPGTDYSGPPSARWRRAKHQDGLRNPPPPPRPQADPPGPGL